MNHKYYTLPLSIVYACYNVGEVNNVFCTTNAADLRHSPYQY